MPKPPAQSRVLIFGGTFDPPHRAHVESPQYAARELGCDGIIYIPAAVNPLKIAAGTPPPTPATHRLAMLRLALAEVPNSEISTIELDRKEGGPSYTIDTLRTLAADAAMGTMRLLIGADQALDFHRWKDWREIIELATPAVMLRPPWTKATYAQALRDRYDADEARQWEERTLKTLPMIDASATEIRRRLAAGESIDALVHPDVAAYARHHRLYRDG